MESISSLQKSIMRRIYAVWFVRKVASPAVLKGFIAAALLWRLKEYVSLRNVIANAPSLADPAAALGFFQYAFLHTQSIVQILALSVIALCLWLARDVIRAYAVLFFGMGPVRA